ncbi:30S ribosomal protein S6--L-glutamate ligase [Coxiella endosymbiont of Amblyomma americanum]|uniref:30S ribosomal protein S6--L-glutamate ligase n=1 Tax=Coxiella endosymbiont of Amblyomma americanum TaxID=325775 RepID=UPI00057D60CD|nr:30S ribosomal protein S6--L-glutamate ligase [Coxiella endosymbiont of Amblyomma americanum]AJC50228.1 ribosomal protein S6 modification protein [Coxiella endosymbiont of Amblyomma americanum]AUJ58590.1 30S ribosomal protein S6--L-glutamate ligase [Coxiella-like endosymbiont of Amblyomma americanum]
MKIIILSTKKKLYSTQRLKEAAWSRGHQVKIINTLRCYMSLIHEKPTIHYMGKKLAAYDAIIPRIGSSVTFYGTAVVRQFEMMGIFCLNSSIAITRSRDKFRSLQFLSRKGIDLPITGFAHSPDDIDDLIQMVGGPPLIIKLIEGTQGIGVVLAETKKAAESVIQAFLGLKVNIIIQEFIEETQGRDVRCFVINNKVVAAMQREAQSGDFRSNVHRGGTIKLIKITPKEREIAINAVKAMGLNVAGVDLLRSKRGPLVLEVNASPGLRGIETITRQDIAGMIINFIERNAKPIKKYNRYQG